MINLVARGHMGRMGQEGLVLGYRPVAGETAPETSNAARVRELVDRHYDFVWRSLRRLGVAPGEVDDAAQQVFCTSSRKLDAIRPGTERGFLFQTALRVASDSRRAHRRRREVSRDADSDDVPDTALPADDAIDLRWARRQLDEILDEMPMKLRAVFVLFEFDQATMSEISTLLGLPAGTVASRLRRARSVFQQAVARIAPRDGGTP